MNIAQLFEEIKWMPSLDVSFIDVIQIIILAFVLFYLEKTLYKTRAWILVKGLFIIGIVYIFISLTDMIVLQTIMQGLFGTILIAIIIMLQPELQRIVELIGAKKLPGIKSFLLKKPQRVTWYDKNTICEIVEACNSMGSVKTGALIVLERGIPLKEYLQSGIAIDSVISKQMLINIFEKNTPLHDGAVIIRKNKIASATCYLPLSMNYGIDKSLGTRHRAALGITESSDCVVIVVSEETGNISFCVDGKIHHNLTPSQLNDLLQENMYKGDETFVEKKEHHSPIWMKVLAPILSVVIWMTVMTTIDPVTTTYISDIPVTPINTEALDDVGQAYTIESGTTVNIKVTGRRAILDNLTADDFIAIADFEELSLVYAVPVSVKAANEAHDLEIEIRGNSVMKLQIEDVVQTDVPVIVDIIGDSNNDYVIQVKDTSTKTVTVTCPESVAKTLEKAVLTVDVYGKRSNYVASATPVIYDKNGNKIEKNVSVGQASVKVEIDVYGVKEIPFVIKLAEQDTKAEMFFRLNDYVVEKDTLRLAGPLDILSNIDVIEVVISPDVNSDVSNTILANITPFIPEGVLLAKDQEEQIEVSVDLSKMKNVTIDMAATDIVFSGVDTEKWTASIVTAPNKIQVVYDMTLLENTEVNLELLKPTIQVEEVKAGEFITEIVLTEIDGVEIVNPLNVRYRLAEKKG